MRKEICQICLDSVDAAEIKEYNGEKMCQACYDRRLKIDNAGPKSRPYPGFICYTYEDAINWCAGRNRFVRIPILLYLAYMLYQHWFAAGLYGSWFAPLNLGVHELGHYIWKPFGEFLEVLGGSLSQCLLPVIAIPMFMRQRDYFAISICIAWLGDNLINVGTYVGDARAMQLPLVTPGGGHAKHDWHYLLNRLGMLSFDTTFEFMLRICGTCLILACLASGVWLITQMGPRRKTDISGF